MMLSQEEETKIRRCLLSGAGLEDAPELEERLLRDDAFVEQVLLVEDELIEDYVRGVLDLDERHGFEAHFLSTPTRRRKLMLIKGIRGYASDATVTASTEGLQTLGSTEAGSSRITGESKDSAGDLTEKPAPSYGPTLLERLHAFWGSQSWWPRAALAVAVVAVTAALWLSRPAPPPAPRTFAILTLAININNRHEGAQAGRVKLPLAADALRISLVIPERVIASGRYRVEMVSDDGNAEHLQVEGLHERSLSVVLPAARLTRGQYTLRLFATDADGIERRIGGSYFFTVE
jgi:hypothetical protein